ncbi:phospho-N-acetylmuramoyl-pentapeptide-transferase [Alkalibaculum sp. M08DMB]|uniref:Phospho-N-acetylmuramoyl-pentapeptide-transferase n=1 Tax=Alkalibaculum sporogenes TaxID=2655001 RepID=A0A6A7K6T4_9FIRM|nr:phospho-N-acetylmuramoyl-pentapeptide-transferase [Alkalibaculum sporogenes]MPW25178.1 phospho-N-acetylmuramoyl-pentapeptide-transferase [Alkalibaculum sporogenes]
MKLVILSTFISFIIIFIIGPYFIPFLQRLKFGQSIREEGPQSHMVKSGTPTMGGLMILFAIILTSLLFITNRTELFVALIATIGFGIIGFIDDFIKIILKRNLGLKAYQKLLLQFAIAIFIAVYAANHQNIGTVLAVPFTNMLLDMNFLYIPFTIIFIVGFVNAVNLTDGLDGLASGASFFSAVFFVIASLYNGYYELALFAGSLVGACLGFLRYNIYPAKVFMGDTGSLALGGALISLAVLTRMELFFFIVGGLFLVEAASVIIQVSYFKISKGKRIFRMTPIHHHYELKGWHEKKVVRVFWLIAFLLAIIGYIALIINI